MQLKNSSLECRYSSFQGKNGVEEVFITLCPTQYDNFQAQLYGLEKGFHQALELLGLSSNSTVFMRFYCSDLANQYSSLCDFHFSNPKTAPYAVSVVEQPPLTPAKIALSAYLIVGEQALNLNKEGNCTQLTRGALQHTWATGLIAPDVENSYEQTHQILSDYQHFLNKSQQTLQNETIRTWFYVKDVDSNYQGLVEARNEVFQSVGLTPETHYIASTGIEGAYYLPEVKVILDSYSIQGVKSEQIRYLNALDYLGYTHDYGVAFERATQVSYQDRSHIFVSGTASINHKGEILHEQDVELQLERTLQNINALLEAGGATLNDLKHCTVYIRDPVDAQLVHQRVAQQLKEIPFVVVTAPVCRPGWLIEIEGIACINAANPSLPDF